MNRHYPPVTSIDAPFTYELLSEARKAMTSATSANETVIRVKEKFESLAQQCTLLF
jgi:hypothetical protein